MTGEEDARRRATLASMWKRLRRVRGNMTDAQFCKLLIDMLRTAERFAEIDAAHTRRLPWSARGSATTE